MLDNPHMQHVIARVIAIATLVAMVVIVSLLLAVTVFSPAAAGEYHDSRATDRAHCIGYGIDTACGYRAPWRVRQAQRRAWHRHHEDLRAYRRGHYLPGVVVHRERERRTFKVDRRAWHDDESDRLHSRDDGDRLHRGGRGKCMPPLAAVGDQYASEAGAQQEADKAWMQTARWQWGERYMSRENADHAAYECGRSSVGSVVGQVFYRCRLTAEPCPPRAARAN